MYSRVRLSMLTCRDSAQLTDAYGPKTVWGSGNCLHDILEDCGVPVSLDMGETYCRENMPHTLPDAFRLFPVLPKHVLEDCPPMRGYTGYSSAVTSSKEVLVLRFQLPLPVPDHIVS